MTDLENHISAYIKFHLLPLFYSSIRVNVISATSQANPTRPIWIHFLLCTATLNWIVQPHDSIYI